MAVAKPAAALPLGSEVVHAPSERRSMLVLDSLSKRFGRVQAVNEVSLTLNAGEIHCLLGENGAGKSTLCNLIFGVHQPDSGTMELDGAPYTPAGPADALKAGIAMVHQH